MKARPIGSTESKSNEATIIFLHTGNPSYLSHSFAQARRSNPNATIILLGDDSNSHHQEVTHVHLDSFSASADEFSKYYRHFSTNAYGFELAAFRRWFILREFLEERAISRCLYVDTDTMIFGDITKEQKNFEQFGMTLTGMLSGNTCFINRTDVLNGFCDFLLTTYRRAKGYAFDRIVAQYALRRKNKLSGGACDMTALQIYFSEHYADFGEVANIVGDSLFDPNINIPEPGFEMENGIKKVYWKENIPFGKHLSTGRMIRFNSLHFQGPGAKEQMKNFLR